MIHANWKGNVQIFKTNCSTRAFDDWLSEDMYSGGHSMESLISLYGKTEVSACTPSILDQNVCWTRRSYKELAEFAKHPQKYAREIGDFRRLLFRVFRGYARLLSLTDAWNPLIQELITTMENKTHGGHYASANLNAAFKRLIERESGRQNSRSLLRDLLLEAINWEEQKLTRRSLHTLKNKFAEQAYLPKFTGFRSLLNGTKISVHDIHALKINLFELQIQRNFFRAKFEFVGQDHFGLDFDDVRKYNHPIFRAWCTLQHSKLFAYPPFFTEMRAIIEVQGIYDRTSRGS